MWTVPHDGAQATFAVTQCQQRSQQLEASGQDEPRTQGQMMPYKLAGGDEGGGGGAKLG